MEEWILYNDALIDEMNRKAPAECAGCENLHYDNGDWKHDEKASLLDVCVWCVEFDMSCENALLLCNRGSK